MKTTLPAYPLITSDPYISIWSRSDHPAKSDTIHWAGTRKRLVVTARVDGTCYALVGRTAPEIAEPAELAEREVTATTTTYTYTMGSVTLSLAFRAPLLLDDLDLASTPVTYVCMAARTLDGKEHGVAVELVWHDDICRDSATPQPMSGKSFASGDVHLAWMGRKTQPMLCHSGDHVTIDWGYAYMLSDTPVAFRREKGHWALGCTKNLTTSAEASACVMLGYDDVASINYFGYIAKAWYARNGKTLPAAMKEYFHGREDIFRRMDALDGDVASRALAAGGNEYVVIANAAYRQAVAAHKIIADRNGQVVFLSKENDSNGCIGTVDVSYPSIPLFLIYAPELVRGMCRPILEFAKMPVWNYDFAPHDVGRYPIACGQVYGLSPASRDDEECDITDGCEYFPPTYLYDGTETLYFYKRQMPVEESGNMILMLAAALKADGADELIRKNLPLLSQWVKYLEQYGADPGEQLCTDDFAGHLAHNVNLAFKAVCGLAAYAFIMEHFGETDQAAHYRDAARKMAQQVVAKARNGNGTGLTLDGAGWSLKYNAVWDILFGFGLFDKSFFADEIKRYLEEQNEFGVPLDSRKDYTKSDWILWAATLSCSPETIGKFCAPMVKYLAETPTKVPFSDWYDTKTGSYMHFIARSVQGGLFMPALYRSWCGA